MSLQHLLEIKPTFLEFEIEGVKYKAKELTGEEFKAYQKEIISYGANGAREYKAENVMSALVFAALYDENEQKVFSPKDRKLVEKLPQRILTEIFEYVSKANGMGDDEDKVKN